MKLIMIDDLSKLMEEVKADPIAYRRLQEKAQWEHMTLRAVLRQWKDPRTWEQPPIPPSKQEE